MVEIMVWINKMHTLEWLIVFFGLVAVLSGVGGLVTATHPITTIIGIFGILVGIVGITGILYTAYKRFNLPQKRIEGIS
jgi:hypothetical protein